MNSRAEGVAAAIRELMGGVRLADRRTADAVQGAFDELLERVDAMGFRETDALAVAVRDAQSAYRAGDSALALQRLSRALLLITIRPAPHPKRKGE